MPPHKRNVNTVFQSYALFPHLDVAGNVAFGLKYQKLDKEDAARRVGEVLELVKLTGLRGPQAVAALRRPAAAGRARPRARAQPRVLLLDEPLGALDARLRKNLQVELKALQAELGVTFVFVTHDQEEALTMSDRIAVMNNGRVEQAGSPREVYEEPRTSVRRGLPRRLEPARRRRRPPTARRCSLRIGERDVPGRSKARPAPAAR